MLLNKAKRAERRLKQLPFIPLQGEQVTFLFGPAEFKTQIIDLIRNAQKRIYITALYWQKDEAGQEILAQNRLVPNLILKFSWIGTARNAICSVRKNPRPMPIGMANNAEVINAATMRLSFLVCRLILVKYLECCILKALFLTTRYYTAAPA